MTTLLAFLLEHADEAELDPVAMAQLDKLVRLALAGQPEVQQILETQVPQVGAEPAPKYPWSAETGFHRPLFKEDVDALTKELVQLVGYLGPYLCVLLFCFLSLFLSSFLPFFFFFFFH